MNISTSECISGCESGWTMYLDHFSSSTDQCNRNNIPLDNNNNNDYGSKGEFVYEDEDLSMLSDASSGPPNFHREQEQDGCSEETSYGYNFSAAAEPKKNKHRNKEQTRIQQNFHLDDTASSPLMNFSKASHKSIFHQNNAVLENDKSVKEHDSGYSSTHYKGKSVLKKHFGFIKNSRNEKAD